MEPAFTENVWAADPFWVCIDAMMDAYLEALRSHGAVMPSEYLVEKNCLLQWLELAIPAGNA